MPARPNCGSIVMEGDPYCSHCGAHFNWAFIDEVDDVHEFGVVLDSGYGDPISYKFYTSKSVHEKPGGFLDFGELSETYRIAGENELEYIADMVCATSSQKLQLKAQIREYQKATDFN